MFKDMVRARGVDAFFGSQKELINQTTHLPISHRSPVPAHCLRMPQIIRLLADAGDLLQAR